MIRVSPPAAARIQNVLASHPNYKGLRVGLKDGGCSGFQWLLAFEDAPADEDQLVDADGARLVVHPMHLPFLAGSTLEWTEGRTDAGFQVVHPGVKHVCGCGESFEFG